MLTFVLQYNTQTAHIVYAANSDIIKAVKYELKKREPKYARLDIYDKEKNYVRNLKQIKFTESIQDEESSSPFIIVNYVDINSREAVDIKATVAIDENYSVHIQIFNIGDIIPEKKKAKGIVNASDEVVQEHMKKEFHRRAEASGKLDIFDSKVIKVRRLDFVKFHEGITKTDGIYAGKAEFLDSVSGEKIDVGITMKNKFGQLQTEDVFIDQVHSN